MRAHKAKFMTLLILSFALGLTACGQEQSSSREKESEAMAGADLAEDEVIAAASTEEGVYGIGDTIRWTNYYGEQISYTLNAVETATNLTDFGIEASELGVDSTQYFSDSGEVLDGEYGTNELLYLTVTVHNIDYPGFQDETNTPYKLAVETLVRTRSELENEDGISHIQPAVYFSAHSEEQKSYYFFQLEADTEMEVNLLWIVPEQDFKEPLYYIIGQSTGRDTYQYFLLNSGE